MSMAVSMSGLRLLQMKELIAFSYLKNESIEYVFLREFYDTKYFGSYKPHRKQQ